MLCSKAIEFIKNELNEIGISFEIYYPSSDLIAIKSGSNIISLCYGEEYSYSEIFLKLRILTRESGLSCFELMDELINYLVACGIKFAFINTKHKLLLSLTDYNFTLDLYKSQRFDMTAISDFIRMLNDVVGGDNGL